VSEGVVITRASELAQLCATSGTACSTEAFSFWRQMDNLMARDIESRITALVASTLHVDEARVRPDASIAHDLVAAREVRESGRAVQLR
jgi:hypothetical protein